MKIRYKKIIRLTNLDPHTLNKNIITELSKYTIINNAQNRVYFKYNLLRFESRARVFNHVDGGVFNFFPETKTIIFTFYISSIIEIIWCFIAALFGIIEDYHILFFIPFITVMFGIRIVSVKFTADKMFDNILDSEIS